MTITQSDVAATAESSSNSFSINHSIARRLPFRTFPLRLSRPILSFSFDDFPISAYDLGAPILEERGVRGTFYACSGQFGCQTDLWTVAPPDAVVDLHRRGHEIGLHTHSHRRVTELRPADLTADLAANRAALRRLLPGTAHETFAYPFGFSGVRQKHRMRKLARASRSVQPALNTGKLDLDFINAFELIDIAQSRATVASLLDQACSQNAWIVFLSHDVADAPTRFGCSPGLLAAAIEEAQRRDMTILPIAKALDEIGAP
jgi:peptidoglycan/xylan/chitin deacetylase (PgdA/CDA1 family)